MGADSPEPDAGSGITLGAYLKRERLRNDMTQRAVADALHMSTSGYEKIENGQRVPHLTTVNALARLFELPSDRRRVLWSIATGDDLAVTAEAPDGVSEGMLVVMRNLRGPAFLHQVPEYNVIAANQRAVRMFPWLDPRLGSADRPINVIVQMMTDPRAQQMLANWDAVVHRLVFGLQEYSLANMAAEKVRAIRDACRVNPEFERMWNNPCPPEIMADDTAVARDPATGALSVFQLDCLRWVFPDRDVELFTLSPRDVDPATDDPDFSNIVLW
ncbi:helix-turn-helix domain-containing protein [Nocardia sp. NPDC059240]|uniref:helix-turn-helix domain-containing protein n=1 Tax=Nocardia sp. NPDC059240 TaxID=3346786 RepID=UPI0036AE2AFC